MNEGLHFGGRVVSPQRWESYIRILGRVRVLLSNDPRYWDQDATGVALRTTRYEVGVLIDRFEEELREFKGWVQELAGEGVEPTRR